MTVTNYSTWPIHSHRGESNATPAPACRSDLNTWRGENSRDGVSTPDGAPCGWQQSPRHTRFRLDPAYAVAGVTELVDGLIRQPGVAGVMPTVVADEEYEEDANQGDGVDHPVRGADGRPPEGDQGEGGEGKYDQDEKSHGISFHKSRRGIVTAG